MMEKNSAMDACVSLKILENRQANRLFCPAIPRTTTGNGLWNDALTVQGCRQAHQGNGEADSTLGYDR